MGDVEAGGEQTGFSVSYVTSPPGIVKIVEAILLLITIASGFACCTGYFLYISIVALIFVIIFFLLYAFNVVHVFPNTNWKKTVFIDSIVFAICMLMGMSVLAYFLNRDSAKYAINIPASAYIAMVAGFSSVIVFIIDAVIHFKLMKAA